MSAYVDDPLNSSLGPLLQDPSPAPFPDASLTLHGQYTVLEGLLPKHMPSLWRNLDLLSNPGLLDYLPWPRPSSSDEFWATLQGLKRERSFVIYAIMARGGHLSPKLSLDEETSPTEEMEAFGIIGYLNIERPHRILELGAVLFSKSLQRTVVATEAMYLMLKGAFEGTALPPTASPRTNTYRRVSWKCSRLNPRSRRAAERLGFVYEGTFRQHLLSRGRSRDSDWLSVLDGEWKGNVKQALEKWLDGENFDSEGKQMRSLEKVRAEVIRGE